MIKTPFSSKSFSSIWIKHFNNSKAAFSFKFIEGVTFVKNKYLPLYVNTGKNLTNGISYAIKKKETDYKKKVFFLYDIPEYYNVNNQVNGYLKLKTIRQYKGYLIDLTKYKNTEDYFSKEFSGKSRWKINNAKKRLEACFKIKYGILCGKDTKKEDFLFVFDYFNKLLTKRFNEKQINNHYLNLKKWSYLQELVLLLILKKEAALFVIYNNDIPVSISLNYISKNILYGALTVFDIDYSKFYLGYIDNLKHIEWCYQNNIEIFDFSKGEFDYKKRLANKEYYFEYHLLYDSKSIRCNIISNSICLFFKFKQLLRENNIHNLFHEMLFYIKGIKYKKTKNISFRN